MLFNTTNNKNTKQLSQDVTKKIKEQIKTVEEVSKEYTDK